MLNPFLLRTALPPLTQAEGLKVIGVERLGKLLADRALSKLLHDDSWPKNINELG